MKHAAQDYGHVIGNNIRNKFKEGKLKKEAAWAIFAYTASDGKTYQVDFLSPVECHFLESIEKLHALEEK